MKTLSRCQNNFPHTRFSFRPGFSFWGSVESFSGAPHKTNIILFPPSRPTLKNHPQHKIAAAFTGKAKNRTFSTAPFSAEDNFLASAHSVPSATKLKCPPMIASSRKSCPVAHRPDNHRVDSAVSESRRDSTEIFHTATLFFFPTFSSVVFWSLLFTFSGDLFPLPGDGNLAFHHLKGTIVSRKSDFLSFLFGDKSSDDGSRVLSFSSYFHSACDTMADGL